MGRKIRVVLSASGQESNIGADKISEETRMHELVGLVADRLPVLYYEIHKNNPAWSLVEILDRAAAFRPDLYIAFHSNAMPWAKAGLATGTEVWIGKGDPRARILATLLVTAVQDALRLPVRLGSSGLAKITTLDNQSHFGEVDHIDRRLGPGMDIPEVLLEIFFHDNKIDIKLYEENKFDLAYKVSAAIQQYSKLEGWFWNGRSLLS